MAHRAGIGHGGPAGGWPLRVPFAGMLTGFGSSYPAIRAQSIFDPGNGPSHDVVGAFWGRLRIVI